MFSTFHQKFVTKMQYFIFLPHNLFKSKGVSYVSKYGMLLTIYNIICTCFSPSTYIWWNFHSLWNAAAHWNAHSALSRALSLSKSGGWEWCHMEYIQSYTGNPRLSLFNLIRASRRYFDLPSCLANPSAWNSNRRLRIVIRKFKICIRKKIK